MKRLISVLIFVLLLSGVGWSATLYVSPTGDNTDGSTWSKAYNLPSSAITAGNAVAGPHTMYIAPGTYTDNLLINNANWDGGIISGTLSSASILPASYGQVIISKNGANPIRVQRNNVTLNYLSPVSADSSVIYYDAGDVLTCNNLYFSDCGTSPMLYAIGGTNFTMNFCWFRGSNDSNYGPIRTGTTSSGVINYCLFTGGSTYQRIAGNAIYHGGSGALVVNNSFFSQVDYSTINCAGGNVTINNSIIYSGDLSSAQYCIKRSAGTVVANNNFFISNFKAIGTYTTGTITLNNNITTVGNPKVIRNARSGFFIPCVDDLTNYAAASTLADTLATYNAKGTFFVNTGNLSTYLSEVQAVLAKGNMEIGLHDRTGTLLSVTGNIYSITSPAGQTIDINRTTGVITITGVGTVADFKTKKLSVIKTELEGLGCTIGELASNIDSDSLGEIMSGSSGAQASPYTPQILIDTTGASGLFKTEMFDAKTTLETFLGITCYTLATPSGSSSTNVEAAAVNAGLWAMRVSNGATNISYKLSGIDLYRIIYFTTQLVGANDAETVRNTRDVCNSIAQNGYILCFVSHNDISTANWNLILRTIKNEYPEINITSLYDAVNTIKNGGLWNATNPRNCTRTWVDQSNLKLTPLSPCVKTGTNVSLSLDYYSKTVHNPPQYWFG